MTRGPRKPSTWQSSTLEQLLAGESPDGPAGYDWTAFPFQVRVRDGFVIDTRQFWVP